MSDFQKKFPLMVREDHQSTPLRNDGKKKERKWPRSQKFVYLNLSQFLELWVHIQVIIRSLILSGSGYKGVLLSTRGQRRTRLRRDKVPAAPRVRMLWLPPPAARHFHTDGQASSGLLIKGFLNHQPSSSVPPPPLFFFFLIYLKEFPQLLQLQPRRVYRNPPAHTNTHSEIANSTCRLQLWPMM